MGLTPSSCKNNKENTPHKDKRFNPNDDPPLSLEYNKADTRTTYLPPSGQSHSALGNVFTTHSDK